PTARRTGCPAAVAGRRARRTAGGLPSRCTAAVRGSSRARPSSGTRKGRWRRRSFRFSFLHGFALPGGKVFLVFRTFEVEVVATHVHLVVLEHGQQRVEAFGGRVGALGEAVALVDLVHRQPALHVLLGFVVEDVLAVVGAEVVLVAEVVRLAIADLGRVALFGEQHRDLAGGAQHRQRLVVEPVAGLLLLAEILEARTVVLVEALGVLLRQPVHLLVAGHPGVEGRGGVVVVEGVPGLVADVVLALAGLLPAGRLADAVARQVLEQGAAVG